MGSIPDMGPIPEVQVRIKNTFLEFIDDDDEVQPAIMKSKTDTAALRPLHLNTDEPSSFQGQCPPSSSACGIAVSTAVAAASAAMAAARAAAAAAAVPQCIAAASGLPVAGLGELPALEPARVAARSRTEKLGRSLPQGRPQGRAVKDTNFPKDAGMDKNGPTTVFLRNLPNDYTRDMLLELMDACGFEGKYDFLYLPTDFSRKAGLGYAFVNMVSPADARLVQLRLEGFRQWSVPSSKVCSVGWSNPCQGLQANIERYRNSPIMHESVPDEFQPMVFAGGVRTRFPPPTKKLRKPDVGKHARHRLCGA